MKFLRKLSKVLLVAGFLLALMPFSLVEACTGFIIGKDLTKDGYTIFGRTEDLEEHHNKNFVIVPAQTYDDDEVLYDRYTTASYKHAKNEYKYYSFFDRDRHSVWGLYGEHGFNEKGVAMTATVSATPHDKILEVDPLVRTGLSEAIMTNLVLPRVKTAREGIELIAKVLDERGSLEGNIVVIADPEETWYMEILSGHQYAAIKFPEDKYAVFPNAYYLGHVDFEDKENYILSPKLVEIAKEAGTYTEKDGQFHVALSYGEAFTDGNHSRTYSGIKNLDPDSPVTWEDGFYELLHSPTDPSRKYTVEDAIAFQRDRFENLDEDFVPSDLKGKVELEEGQQFKYPLGNKNVMEAHIYEMRQDIPKEFGGVLWVAMDASRNNAYIPFYGNMTETHKSFQPISFTYDPNSFYWVADNIDNMVATYPKLFGNSIQDIWKDYEKQAAAELAEQNKKYSEAQMDPDQAAFEVTQDSLKRTEELFNKMKKVEDDMLAKIKEAGLEYSPYEQEEADPEFIDRKEKEIIEKEEKLDAEAEDVELAEGEEFYYEEVKLTPAIQHQVNPNLPVGRDKVLSEGKEGHVTRKVIRGTDKEGKPTTKVVEEIKKEASEPKVVEIGTGVMKTHTIPEDTPLPFETETIEDDTLEKGKQEIVQEGQPGMHVKATRYYYLNGEEYDTEVTYDGNTTEPVKRIVKVGTKEVEKPEEEKPEVIIKPATNLKEMVDFLKQKQYDLYHVLRKNIKEHTSPVSIAIEEGRKVKAVYRLDDHYKKVGEIKDFEIRDGKVVFAAEGEDSYYAIIYEDEDTAATGSDTTAQATQTPAAGQTQAKDKQLPKTGMILASPLLALGLITGGISVYFDDKRRK